MRRLLLLMKIMLRCGFYLVEMYTISTNRNVLLSQGLNLVQLAKLSQKNEPLDEDNIISKLFTNARNMKVIRNEVSDVIWNQPRRPYDKDAGKLMLVLVVNNFILGNSMIKTIITYDIW